MKKAALYARVSSDLQKKEKTIDSQILELKRQISASGDVLVKEYIDDGYSGARLDRPAMDQLRKDLKLDTFEVIYFLNTDRIAREVTYQTIIVAEILKHGKQLIINSKDYIHNPENMFTLTVLGAVSELERAKISERVARGKALKLAQGCHPGRGYNIYGYNFIHKTPTTASSSFTINEEQANAIRFMFTEYTKGGVSLNALAKKLDQESYKTKYQKNVWHGGSVVQILKNVTYTGTRHYNKIHVVKEYANPLHGTIKTSTKYTERDKSEWVGLPIPQIIPYSLWEKVHVQMVWNKSKYRNPPVVQLLSNLITCGSCGSAYTSYRCKRKTSANDNTYEYYRSIYICNGRRRQKDGSRCHTKQITSGIIEAKVWETIETVLSDKDVLIKNIPTLKGSDSNAKLRLKRELIKIEKSIRDLAKQKDRIMDLYTTENIDKDVYQKEKRVSEQKLQEAQKEKDRIQTTLHLLSSIEKVYVCIENYCNTLKAKFEKCGSFNENRKFLLDTIQNIVHDEQDNIFVYGTIPIEIDGLKGKLEFKIKKIITRGK